MRRAIVLAAAVLAGCGGTPQVRERPLDEAVAAGVAFLVSSQNKDGSWGSGRGSSGFDIMASVPGSHDAFRVGTTALCVMALREAGEKEASRRGLDYLVRYDGPRRATRDELYNIWAHTYALQALSLAYQRQKYDSVRKAAERHLDRLIRYETFVGGWNYYDFNVGAKTPSMEPTSFGTAATLVALHEAKKAGLNVPEPMIRRALARVREARNPDGSFWYGTDGRYYPTWEPNRDKGSLGRTQACHFALMVWGTPGIGTKQAVEGLKRLFAHHKFIDIGRKRQYPHEAWYATSGYYYYFGHYYAARLIEKVPDPGRKLREELRSHVLPWQEPDGSWWDYYMWDYHKPYGTAFAIMTLLRCR